MAEQEYQRLTWARRRPSGFIAFSATRSSLWLGSDHLLCIDTTGYTENYKRFYFRDIQAIVIRKTEAWKFVALALGALTGAFSLVAALQKESSLLYVFGVIASLFAIAFVITVAQGPSGNKNTSLAATGWTADGERFSAVEITAILGMHELHELASPDDTDAPSHITRLDWRTNESRRLPALKLPNCPGCEWW